MVREAEKAKARILDTPGNLIYPKNNAAVDGFEKGNDCLIETNCHDSAPKCNLNVTYHSSLLDEENMCVGNYIDETTRRKIGNGEYVDFVKLMPRDKLAEDDHRTEMVNRGGMSYWVPVADREMTTISSFIKWEQAFRVFSNIYTSFHPARAGELIQYNHIIHTASQSFSWENVYRYDREFRTHMSRHHLKHSWAVILQQAWSMFLKDRVNGTHSTTPYNSKHGNNQGNGGSARRHIFFDYNRGSCTFGKRCKFDHRCSFCNRYGHSSFNCRKAMKTGTISGGASIHNNLDSNDRWDRYEHNQQQSKNNNRNNNNHGGREKKN